MDDRMFRDRLASAKKVLIGLGEEWNVKGEAGDPETSDNRAELLAAYDALCQLVKDKDYFIVTMDADGLIFDSVLGSQTETVVSSDKAAEETVSCPATDEATQVLIDRLFPVKEGAMRRVADTRAQRIAAPCGNEEAYRQQWERYSRWFTGTLNQDTLILELGVGFQNPEVIRFPFEKTCFFNQKAYMYRVHKTLPQVAAELGGRAEGVACSSMTWIRERLECER